MKFSVETLSNGLKRWDTRIGKFRNRKKKALTSKLANLLEAKRTDDNLAELIDTKVQLNFEIDKDESYWEQRARVNWLKLGDRNTAFFHSMATQRRRKNIIQKLQNNDVGEEVSTYCLEQPNGDMEVSQINTTHIVLTPKKRNPTNFSHFRPISLCSVIYKIMAKAIAERFKGVLGKCIDKAQSAFVPGRLISDNVLVAYEILHTLKTKRWGKKGLMAVELDISKAYDRVEWGFLEKMMRKMIFDPKWIRLIMKCISTVSYSVVLNNQAGNWHNTKKTSKESKQVEEALKFHTYYLQMTALPLEKRRKGELAFLKRILQEYRRCSGQIVNFEKSSVFFNSNTGFEEKRMVSQLLGVRSSNDPESYLGLPNMVGRRKKEAFLNPKDRFKQKIDN
ncbi:reverse transcriptase [Gossypium australe]|uniref:Reverse transcriptase n=1 Tax=Gossypium australe TaxID=47621 RepID=A0A5B6VTN0_9ROSI|nr:reverse transcriptase [Gossypium australe]